MRRVSHELARSPQLSMIISIRSPCIVRSRVASDPDRRHHRQQQQQLQRPNPHQPHDVPIHRPVIVITGHRVKRFVYPDDWQSQPLNWWAKTHWCPPGSCRPEHCDARSCGPQRHQRQRQLLPNGRPFNRQSLLQHRIFGSEKRRRIIL